MKLLISGSRSITKLDLESYIPDGVTEIISGGAKGIDTLAEEYADRHKIPKTIVLPKYSMYGRAAPIRRDDEMVDMCDTVLAFWDGKSSGTKHTVDYAKKTGKSVKVVAVKVDSE